MKNKLDKLEGLDSIKNQMRQLLMNRGAAMIRWAKGLTDVKQVPFMVFKGNHGTGKATIARLIAGKF